jgi:hypothetical protein
MIVGGSRAKGSSLLIGLIGLIIGNVWGYGQINGENYVNSNNVLANWTIYADNSQNKGIFVTFLVAQLEANPINSAIPSSCSDYLSFKSPSGVETIFCGNQNIQKKLSVYRSDVPITQYSLANIFYFDEPYLSVKFSSNSATPSIFRIWYYSGKLYFHFWIFFLTNATQIHVQVL